MSRTRARARASDGPLTDPLLSPSRTSSLSYDNGKNFHVIQSYIGGCEIDSLNFPLTIPSAAPGGRAIFSWSWFNKSGNREMYQKSVNSVCAQMHA